MTQKQDITTTTTKNDNGTVTVTAVMPAETLETKRDAALAELGTTVKVDGFRPGKIPADVIAKQVGDMAILEEMARLAIAGWYPGFLMQESIEAIGRPEIRITKIAAGSPLEFTITTAVMPTVKLGDVKKIAKEVNKKDRPTDVDDTEVNEAITQLRKFRAQAKMDEERAKEAKEKGEPFTPTKLSDIGEDDLPEITDEYVKGLGNFESVEAFTNQLRDNLKEEKAKKVLDDKRMELMEKLLEASDITLPDLLTEHELDRAMAQVEYDVSMAGMKFEDYLKQLQKTKEEFRASLKPDAEKRAKSRLIIETIAKEHDIKLDEKTYEAEVERMMEQYKDHQHVSEDSVRAYLAEIFQNQAVFAWLDEVK